MMVVLCLMRTNNLKLCCECYKYGNWHELHNEGNQTLQFYNFTFRTFVFS